MVDTDTCMAWMGSIINESCLLPHVQPQWCFQALLYFSSICQLHKCEVMMLQFDILAG